MADALNPVDLLVLVAAHRLGESAYGVTIQADVSRLQGREVSMAAVYTALERLERRGLLRPWLSDPRPERGGRARRHFAVSASGREHIRRAHADAMRLWEAVPVPPAGRRK
jgi:DNA-binding PadR family transcriptional regulator